MIKIEVMFSRVRHQSVPVGLPVAGMILTRVALGALLTREPLSELAAQSSVYITYDLPSSEKSPVQSFQASMLQ